MSGCTAVGTSHSTFCWTVLDDDLCIYALQRNLETTLGTATGAILDIFKGYAMTPNLQPGKTATLVTPRGQDLPVEATSFQSFR